MSDTRPSLGVCNPNNRDTSITIFNKWGRWDMTNEIVPEYLCGNGEPNYQLPSIYCHSLVSSKTHPKSDETNLFGMLLDCLD